MLEIDLIGRKIALGDGDARLLLDLAEEASGRSIGARDLATRLRQVVDPASGVRRRLVLTRAESRALQRTIETHHEPSEQLGAIRLALEDLLAVGRAESGE